MGESLATEIREMTKPLTVHQQILQFRAWDWSYEEIASALGLSVAVVSVVTRSPLGKSVIETLRSNGNRI